MYQYQLHTYTNVRWRTPIKCFDKYDYLLWNTIVLLISAILAIESKEQQNWRSTICCRYVLDVTMFHYPFSAWNICSTLSHPGINPVWLRHTAISLLSRKKAEIFIPHKSVNIILWWCLMNDVLLVLSLWITEIILFSVDNCNRTAPNAFQSCPSW